MSSNFHYITVATKPHIILDKIQTKVSQNNETIHVLGSQENRHIGWNDHAIETINLAEFKSFCIRRARHASEFVVETKEILEGC